MISNFKSTSHSDPIRNHSKNSDTLPIILYINNSIYSLECQSAYNLGIKRFICNNLYNTKSFLSDSYDFNIENYILLQNDNIRSITQTFTTADLAQQKYGSILFNINNINKDYLYNIKNQLDNRYNNEDTQEKKWKIQKKISTSRYQFIEKKKFNSMINGGIFTPRCRGNDIGFYINNEKSSNCIIDAQNEIKSITGFTPRGIVGDDETAVQTFREIKEKTNDAEQELIIPWSLTETQEVDFDSVSDLPIIWSVKLDNDDQEESRFENALPLTRRLPFENESDKSETLNNSVKQTDVSETSEDTIKKAYSSVYDLKNEKKDTEIDSNDDNDNYKIKIFLEEGEKLLNEMSLKINKNSYNLLEKDIKNLINDSIIKKGKSLLDILGSCRNWKNKVKKLNSKENRIFSGIRTIVSIDIENSIKNMNNNFNKENNNINNNKENNNINNNKENMLNMMKDLRECEDNLNMNKEKYQNDIINNILNDNDKYIINIINKSNNNQELTHVEDVIYNNINNDIDKDILIKLYDICKKTNININYDNNKIIEDKLINKLLIDGNIKKWLTESINKIISVYKIEMIDDNETDETENNGLEDLLNEDILSDTFQNKLVKHIENKNKLDDNDINDILKNIPESDKYVLKALQKMMKGMDTSNIEEKLVNEIVNVIPRDKLNILSKVANKLQNDKDIINVNDNKVIIDIIEDAFNNRKNNMNNDDINTNEYLSIITDNKRNELINNNTFSILLEEDNEYNNYYNNTNIYTTSTYKNLTDYKYDIDPIYHIDEMLNFGLLWKSTFEYLNETDYETLNGYMSDLPKIHRSMLVNDIFKLQSVKLPSIYEYRLLIDKIRNLNSRQLQYIFYERYSNDPTGGIYKNITNIKENDKIYYDILKNDINITEQNNLINISKNIPSIIILRMKQLGDRLELEEGIRYKKKINNNEILNDYEKKILYNIESKMNDENKCMFDQMSKDLLEDDTDPSDILIQQGLEIRIALLLQQDRNSKENTYILSLTNKEKHELKLWEAKLGDGTLDRIDREYRSISKSSLAAMKDDLIAIWPKFLIYKKNTIINLMTPINNNDIITIEKMGLDNASVDSLHMILLIYKNKKYNDNPLENPSLTSSEKYLLNAYLNSREDGDDKNSMILTSESLDIISKNVILKQYNILRNKVTIQLKELFKKLPSNFHHAIILFNKQFKYDFNNKLYPPLTKYEIEELKIEKEKLTKNNLINSILSAAKWLTDEEIELLKNIKG
eukprot:GHVL01025465.1.p1 GENE.GHVL01025465.1~~GHVL01025465.1.p1  ORF type:complete len:1244 (+),score=507.37 GHVL01025465.1:566-4297(+)